jgi:polyisoprenoid-binding protein YceI
MTPNEGTHVLGPESGSLVLRTSRAGLGRKAGHDLTIEATGWSATVIVARLEDSSVSVEVEGEALEVREGTGGVLPLGDSDRAEIKKNIRKILQIDRYPTITFRSTRVQGTPGEFTVRGDLTIAGTTRTVDVTARADGGRVRGELIVVQSDFGIKPYSAFFGALKLADEVEVAFDLALPVSADG